MEKRKKRPSADSLELLAPAGNIEVFEAAIKSGADAVYVGAPYMNARALAKNFSFSEIAAMTDFAHSRGVKIYIAMNSLLREEEIRDLLKTLKILYDLRVDALIIQDMGIYFLVKRFFPSFRVHASTLCTVHNSLGVKQFEEMGVNRVVLSRELSLREIGAIKKKTNAEIEVFVNGAMCFSYSGLCLFSSFLGGKSSLRGRCVQPCRRRYDWGRQKHRAESGYFFSMNDLEGIDLLPLFRKAGVTSLKLEGRMRSTHYVSSVVKAYRMVLDGKEGDRHLISEAKNILRESLGRKSSSGYFREGKNSDLISPHHSGNTGLFLGSIDKSVKNRVSFVTREDIRVGDRLRLHSERTGERTAFTLQSIVTNDNSASMAKAKTKVQITTPVRGQKGDSLYKVDSKESRQGNVQKLTIDLGRYRSLLRTSSNKNFVNNIILEINSQRRVKLRGAAKKHKFSYMETKKGRRNKQRASFPLPWWLKIADFNTLKKLNNPTPDRVVLSLNKDTITQGGNIAALKKRAKGLILALPAIIEESSVDLFQNEVKKRIAQGCRDWQIGHLSQLQLFPKIKARKINIYGDYTLNVLNSLSIETLKQFKILGAQLSIEADSKAISEICKNARGMELGMTVYGTPPLFTAKANPNFFKFGKPFVSPKGESFMLKKNFGTTLAIADRPFSLLPWIMELAEGGLSYMVIDLTNSEIGRGTIPALMKTAGTQKRAAGASSFNYLGKLL